MKNSHYIIMHQSIETPAPRPPGHSGDLTGPKPGFNALLTACWQGPWSGDLTACDHLKRVQQPGFNMND